MTERRMGFVPPKEPLEVEKYGLVIASVDPKEFVRQLEEARAQAPASGSDRAEVDATFLENLKNDVEDSLNTPAPLVTQKIVSAVYRPGNQNDVTISEQR